MSTSEAFVLDGSVTMAWFFKDEMNDYANSVRDSLDRSRAVVPSLWSLEVANTVLVGERRKRSTQSQAATWLGFLGVLPIETDDETSTGMGRCLEPRPGPEPLRLRRGLSRTRHEARAAACDPRRQASGGGFGRRRVALRRDLSGTDSSSEK